MTVTIRDVAKRAGVGLGTVSRVINNSPQVREETRQRVERAIRELDFRPNPLARGLSLGKTHDIAAVIPFFTRASAVERLRGAAITIAGSEYDLVVFNVETAERRDAICTDLSRADRADGVLIISLPLSEGDLERFRKSGTPLVLIDVNDPRLENFHRVVVDDLDGGRIATQHLIDLGHRRLGFIGDQLDGPFAFTSSLHRHQGFANACSEAGLEQPDMWQGFVEYGRNAARRRAREILSLPEHPTAFFAASDTQALGVLEAAQELGLRVPEDLSVIGYDDIESAEYFGLTTIRQMLYESGSEGVKILFQIMQNPSETPIAVSLPTELVIRNSTTPPG